MLTSRRLLIPLAGLLAVVVGFLLWGNLSGNLVYYLTPSEAMDQQSDFSAGERFRLGGLVEEGSVATTADGVTFVVGDGATSITVVHTGAPPQLFQENVGVVVEGTWAGAEFHSDELLVKHDEQYRAPDGEGEYVPPNSSG
jgi:cytochrome c-type biogenesis protein CcmE